MKKSIIATFIVALFGVFTVFATSQTGGEKCNSNCCKTELCRTYCVESECCEKDKTCDITNHTECKHKCCDAEKKECHVSETKSCCTVK